MVKKIIFLLITLSIIFPDDCELLKTLFESNDINAAYVEIMSSFMLKGKAEYDDSDCNFVAYKVSIALDDSDLAKKYIESAININDKAEYRDSASKLTNTIREYKSAKYTLDNNSVDDAISEFKQKINSSNLLKIALFHKGLGTAYKKKHLQLNADLLVNDEAYFDNLNESVKYFNEAIKINSFKDYDDEILNISKYLTKIGKEKVKEEDYQTALNLFNKAIEYSPKYLVVYFYKGDLYLKLQDYELALESFKAGLGENIKEGNYKILYMAGCALERLGDFDKALQFYEFSLNNKPTYTKAHFSKANILYKQQNFNDAKENLIDIISRDPNYIKAYELLVNIFLDLNELQNAKQYAEEGVLIDSKTYSLFSHLAFISNELKEYDDAIIYGNKSLNIKQKFGPAAIELGRAYTFKCNKVAAEEYFNLSRRYDSSLYRKNLKWSKDYIAEKCKK